MQDQFGRTIEYLRLSVTDRCNLRCRYCMPEEGIAPIDHRDILSYEEMVQVAAAAVGLGVRKIRITGGEPLVRKGLTGLIRQLSGLPGPPEIVLTTNGLLLAEQAAALKEAGLARVNVSLDTLRPDRFPVITRREGLERVLSGLETAERVDLAPVKVNMVPILGVNDDEIGAFARLTFDHPWEVRFIEFMPVGGGLGYSPQSRMPASRILEQMAAVGPLHPAQRRPAAGPARLFRFPGAKGTVGIIPAVSEHFCGECNRLRLTADGRLRPCLFSAGEIDLKAALRGGAAEADLKRVLLEAVGAKPEKHPVGEPDFAPGGRAMRDIGG